MGFQLKIKHLFDNIFIEEKSEQYIGERIIFNTLDINLFDQCINNIIKSITKVVLVNRIETLLLGYIIKTRGVYPILAMNIAKIYKSEDISFLNRYYVYLYGK